jgi:hypothetical protein
MAARLPLRRAAQAAQVSSALLQLRIPHYLYAGRAVARNLLDLSHLGRAARAGARRGFRVEAVAQVPSPKWWARLLGGLVTFNFVCFTWIFFRATSLENALAILRSLGSLTWSADNLTPLVLGVLVLAAILHSLPPSWFDFSAGLAAHTPFWVQGLVMAALILLIQTLAGRGSAPFVYGNF